MDTVAGGLPPGAFVVEPPSLFEAPVEPDPPPELVKPEPRFPDPELPELAEPEPGPPEPEPPELGEFAPGEPEPAEP